MSEPQHLLPWNSRGAVCGASSRPFLPSRPSHEERFNTLFYILQRQRPDLSLRVCHRLDRLTSGLTILAKTAERAGVIQKQIGKFELWKQYIPRLIDP